MKILYICNEYPPAPHGGIGTYTKFLAEELAKKGHEIMVVGYDPSVAEAVEETVNGVRIFRYPTQLKLSGRLGKALSFITERRSLSRIIDRICESFKTDIVESYDWSGPLFKKPAVGHLVVRMHGAHAVYNDLMGRTNGKSRLLRLAEKRNLNFADSRVSVSHLILEKTVSTFDLQSDNITVIYNGVDVDRFQNNSAKHRDLSRLLFVGRVHYHKGLDLLFQALKIVFSLKSGVYLDVIGPADSDYAKDLKKSIPQWMCSRINFHGRVPNENLPVEYASANLCLVPSRVEAFPIVPLESMACGTPVVMSSLVASAELIDDGVDGFIQDPRDAEGLAGCILTALNNQNRVESMRSLSRAKITDRFSLGKIVSDNIQFYNNCLK